MHSSSTWLSVTEAATHARVSRSSLYLLIAAGALPVRKLGRRTLIAREELDALIISGTAPATKAGAP